MKRTSIKTPLIASLLTLALPIMIGQLATTAMGFVDAVMALA